MLFSSDHKNADSDDEDYKERGMLAAKMNGMCLGVVACEDNTEEQIDQNDAVGKLGPGCINSYKIMGDFLDNTEVYAYDVFYTDPAIPPTAKEQRRLVFTGGDWRAMTKKRDHWSENLGPAWVFDTSKVWSTNPLKNGGTELVTLKNSCYNASTITLKFQGKVKLNKLPTAEAERMTNILVVRKVMSVEKKQGTEHPAWQSFTGAGTGQSWYNTVSGGRETVDNNRRRGEESITVWFGYQIKITLGRDRQTRASAFFLKVAESTRLQLTKNLQGILSGLQAKYMNSFAREAQFYVNRKAYLVYSNQRGVVIGEFHWDKNESHKIEHKGVMKTLKQYYLEVYGLNVGKQICLISQKGSPTTFFLPELLVLSAKSDDAPLNYGDALKFMGKSQGDRFAAIGSFVPKFNRDIEKSELRGKLKVSETPERVTLIQLDPPAATCKGKNGAKVSLNLEQCPSSWVRSTGGPMEVPGGVKLFKSLAIKYRPEQEREAEEVVKTFKTYIGQRNLRLADPILVEIPPNMSIGKEETYRGQGGAVYDATVTILPDGVIGSQMKTLNSAQAYYSPGNDNPAGPMKGPVHQHILARNCTRPNAVKGALGNLVQKGMNRMYETELNLSANNKQFSTTETWAVGTSVHHSGANKPSMACMYLDTKPAKASPEGWNSIAIPLDGRKQIVAGRRMALAFLQCLKKAVTGIPGKEVGKMMPSKLVFWRDGLADNQVTEFLKEEHAGVLKAIRLFARANAITWSPEVVVCVIPKQGMADLCPCDSDGRPVKADWPSSTVVVDVNAMSSQLVELLIIANKKAKNSKPKRVIVAYDSGDNTRTVATMRNLAEYYLFCCWNYAFALPFSTGCTTLPTQIKMASKGAELTCQFITSKDKDLSRFATSSASWRPTMLQE